MLWSNSSFRNYAIWLADSILAYISGTRFFPNIEFVQEHSKFIIEQIQWKLMTKFFFKAKKPVFGPFPQFLGQKKFFKKNQVVMHKFIRVSSTPAKSREIWWSNSKKTRRQMSGGKDGQTLFHRIFPATAKGKYNCSRLAFKTQI